MMKLWQFLSVILILSISPLEISGQNNSGIVSGSVFNSGQEPLVGVSVFVKGTNIGTMTDADGRFSVKAEDGQSLEFRYIGYDTKVVTVNGKTMSVTMSENQVILDDVVVIGYGTQKKSDLTGSLSSVKGEDIVLPSLYKVKLREFMSRPIPELRGQELRFVFVVMVLFQPI